MLSVQHVHGFSAPQSCSTAYSAAVQGHQTQQLSVRPQCMSNLGPSTRPRPAAAQHPGSSACPCAGYADQAGCISLCCESSVLASCQSLARTCSACTVRNASHHRAKCLGCLSQRCMQERRCHKHFEALVNVLTVHCPGPWQRSEQQCSGTLSLGHCSSKGSRVAQRASGRLLGK